MTDTKKKKAAKELVFTVGVNLADGSRFEAGDDVPSDLSAKEIEALREMNAVAEKE